MHTWGAQKLQELNGSVRGLDTFLNLYTAGFFVTTGVFVANLPLFLTYFLAEKTPRYLLGLLLGILGLFLAVDLYWLWISVVYTEFTVALQGRLFWWSLCSSCKFSLLPAVVVVYDCGVPAR